MFLCGNGKRFGKPSGFKRFQFFTAHINFRPYLYVVGAGFKARGDDGHEAGGFVFGYYCCPHRFSRFGYKEDALSRVFGIEFKAASYQLDDPAFGKYFVYLARYDVGYFGDVRVCAGTFGFFAFDLGYSVAKERACGYV